MKELVVLLMSWLTISLNNGQIVFPDELESIQNGYAGTAEINYAPAALAASNYANDGFSSSPNGQTEVSDTEAQYWSNHVTNLLSRGVSKFTLDMDRAIYRSLEKTRTRGKPNVIFSPLSLVSTLAMVLLGSAGVTFDQVTRILGLESGVDISAHSEIVHQMLGPLLNSIDAGSGSLGPQVTTASGMFVQNGYPIRPAFMEISQRVYKNEVINLDFLDHTVEATKTVNDWVKVRTRGKISDILDQPVDSNTKLIIASALYFSGEWDRYFSPGDTRRRPFMVTPNESVLVDMMYNGGKFPFYEDEGLGVKMIGLPYKGYEPGPSSEFLSSSKFQATMYIMLPISKDADALTHLESRLNPDNIEDMIGKMVNRTCVVVFPRMKLSSSLNLNDALKELGLSSLFDARTSNLGLLSPGYNETAEIFTRFGGDEDDNTTTENGEPRVANNKNDKDNHFRYEDKRGGYTVDQWNSGVLIQKIPNSYPQKRSINGSMQANKNMTDERNMYETPFTNSSLIAKLKVIAIGKDKYRFESSIRSKRQQARPIDNAFVRFIESRRVLPNYGLDDLRNSPNLTNPGLFASDVLHKVEMDVTETGTVAAATTAIVLQRGGDIKNFLANRPFLFFIRHEHSKLILFWGTVNKPTPSY